MQDDTSKFCIYFSAPYPANGYGAVIFSKSSDILMHSIVFYMKGGSRMAADKKRLDIAAIYERHSKTVYRVCFAFMKNQADHAFPAADF